MSNKKVKLGHKTLQSRATISRLEFLHDAVQRDLDRQLQAVGVLDTKSTILVALDAGALALASGWEHGGVAAYLAVVAWIVLLLGLGASLVYVVKIIVIL